MNAPTMRIVIGTAGSGKSTIAQRLARQHGAAYLDKDAMSARFVEAALVSAGYDPGDRESNQFYRDSILPLEYDSLLDVAGANLRLGCPVVVDAPNGTTANAENAHVAEMIGARANRNQSAAFGRSSSLNMSLITSASGCSIPFGPTRYGPIRCCSNAATFRST